MSESIKQSDKKYYMNTFGDRLNVCFEKGEGIKLFADNGDIYYDFLGGIAVNSLGHSHPDFVKCLKEQAEKLLHTSSLYYIENQAKVAQKLVETNIVPRIIFIEAVNIFIKSIAMAERPFIFGVAIRNSRENPYYPIVRLNEHFVKSCKHFSCELHHTRVVKRLTGNKAEIDKSVCLFSCKAVRTKHMVNSSFIQKPQRRLPTPKSRRTCRNPASPENTDFSSVFKKINGI